MKPTARYHALFLLLGILSRPMLAAIEERRRTLDDYDLVKSRNDGIMIGTCSEETKHCQPSSNSYSPVPCSEEKPYICTTEYNACVMVSSIVKSQRATAETGALSATDKAWCGLKRTTDALVVLRGINPEKFLLSDKTGAVEALSDAHELARQRGAMDAYLKANTGATLESARAAVAEAISTGKVQGLPKSLPFTPKDIKELVENAKKLREAEKLTKDEYAKVLKKASDYGRPEKLRRKNKAQDLGVEPSPVKRVRKKAKNPVVGPSTDPGEFDMNKWADIDASALDPAL